jgi:membrane associated rhomboid family serine protease
MPKWSLTKWFILINCTLAVWSMFLGLNSEGNWVKLSLPLNLPDLLAGQWWRIFTTSWVHADLVGVGTLHLFFNMMSLAMLGQMVEGTLGRKHFCLIYFPAGLMAIFFYLAEMYVRIKILGQNDYLQNSLVGASGCITGLAAAFAVMHPNRRIVLLPWPFPIRASTAIIAFGLISLALIFIPYLNFMAHSAHLGGLVWGFIYMGLIGWYKKPKATTSIGPFQNPQELAVEAAMLAAMTEEQMLIELPAVIRKLHYMGPGSLSRREQAFLLKARSMSLI